MADGDKIGQITRHSLDASKYLGSPPDGEIIGKNVNDLLPQRLRDSHREAMRDMSTRFHEKDSQTYTIGFDGQLRLLLTTVKVSPSLSEKGLNVVSMFRESEESINDESNKLGNKKKQISLQTDLEGQILDGDNSMTRIRHIMNTRCNWSLSKFIPDLKCFLQLVRLSSDVLSLKDESCFNLFRSSLVNCLKTLSSSGETKGVSFRLVLPDSQSSQRVRIRHKVLRYFKEDIFRLDLMIEDSNCNRLQDALALDVDKDISEVDDTFLKVDAHDPIKSN